MALEKYVDLTHADLTNNCPECFHQGLSLTFKQKHKYGKLYDRTTKEVIHELQCKKCNSVIYPVKWTDDIERSFNYYQKTVVPEKAVVKFNVLFYVLIGILLGIIIAVIYLIQNNLIPL